MPTPHRLIRLAENVLMTMVIVIILAFVYTVGPWLETRYWPVVGKLQIEKIEMVGLEKSLVFAAFEKKRNCEYLGIAWFKGRPKEAFIRVPIKLGRREDDTSSPNRPQGFQRAGPWELDLTREEILTNSFARLYHRCWPFWTSTTEFFP